MNLTSPIIELELPILHEKKVSLFVKREDLLHPVISGNKYRKLYYNLRMAEKLDKKKLITFGGAYSNHILATACAGAAFGFETVGIIRGEELADDLSATLASNPTLKAATEYGMRLQFITRSAYKKKQTTAFLKDLQEFYPEAYLIPEGGTNDLAVKGCEEILDNQTEKFDVICVAVGTGGTISGIINASNTKQRVIGFPALKGDFLREEIEKNKITKTNWELNQAYHFGGYGKVTKELVSFVNDFKKEVGIPLDPIYTGKMMFGVLNLIAKDFFPENSKILTIHTGGLQGIRGMNILLKKRGLPLIDF
jgi:1-aminocyclopropane-1-carboxylate deaminase